MTLGSVAEPDLLNVILGIGLACCGSTIETLPVPLAWCAVRASIGGLAGGETEPFVELSGPAGHRGGWSSLKVMT